MRRIAAALGILASAGILVASTQAQTAAAASGTLTVNGRPYTNPHGCYPANSFMVTVVNRTDQTAYIYPNGGCWGEPEGWVLPGGQTTQNGASVYIE